MNKIQENYTKHYVEQNVHRLYPTEFVVRSFMGNYPEHRMEKNFKGKSILDLGFGDGRNVSFLADLGFRVFGVEISQAICEVVRSRMKSLGVNFEPSVGSNSSLPYEDDFFDYILSCNSCYYIDKGKNFSDNLIEISRVLKSGGTFVLSLPMKSTFIMDGASDLGDGHMLINADPYGCRVGSVLKKFDSPEDIKKSFSPFFMDIKIGHAVADYWGSAVHLFYIVCRNI